MGTLVDQPMILTELALNTPFGSSVTPVYTDMTNRAQSKFKCSRGQQYQRSQAQAGTYSGTWRNNDSALDPKNASSPYFPGIDLYAPLRIRAQYPHTQQLLSGDQATAGEVTPIAPGAIPASMNITAALGTPVIASSASAWQGAQVYSTPVGASATVGQTLLEVTGIPVQATTSGAPATSYAWSIYARSVTSGATPSACAQLVWLNAAGGVVSTTSGSTAAMAAGGAGSAWTRFTVAATAPAGAVSMDVALALEGTAPSSAWSCQTDGLQTEWATVASAWTLPGTWYAWWAGALNAIPREYAGDGTVDGSGNYPVARVTGTDVLGILAQQKLNDCYINTLLGYTPRFLYALNEAAVTTGNQYFSDLTGQFGTAQVIGSGAQLAAGTSIFTGTPATIGFAGTNGPCVTITDADAGQDNFYDGTYTLCKWWAAGVSLGQPGSVGPAPNSAWTRVVAVNMADVESTVDDPGGGFDGSPYLRCTVWSCVGPSPSGSPQVSLSSYIPISWSSGVPTYGTPELLFEAYSDGGVHITQAIWSGNSPTRLDCGYWCLVAISLSANGQTFTIDIGSTLTGTTYSYTVSTGGTDFRTSSATSYTTDVVGCWWAPWQQYDYTYGSSYGPIQYGMNGQLALVADFDYAITSGQFADMWDSFQTAYAGDTYAQRIQRYLTWGGLEASATLDTGSTTYGAAGGLGSSGSSSTPFTGTDPLSALQLVVWAEWGMMFPANTGAFTARGRGYRWSQVTPVVSLGEGLPMGAAGEVPYAPPTVGYDNAVLINVAQLTVTNATANAAVNPPVGAINYASVAKYFPQVVQQTINPATNAQALSLAQWLVNAYGVPQDRISSVAVSPTHTAGIWPACLGLELDELLEFNRRPLGGALLSILAFAENIAWDVDMSIPRAVLTVQGANAALNSPWLVAPVHTTLQSQANATSTTLVINALPDASTNKLAWSMLPTQQLELSPGTSIAETVTVVPPLPATSVGYTSATITVTPALANTHPAGAWVCAPVPAGVTNPTVYDSRALPGSTTIVGF